MTGSGVVSSWLDGADCVPGLADADAERAEVVLELEVVAGLAAAGFAEPGVAGLEVAAALVVAAWGFVAELAGAGFAAATAAEESRLGRAA